MTDTSASAIVPFGKYKGRPIDEVLISDPSYLQWLTGQDWFRAKYVNLHQVIINRGAEPADTPEHNALQVLFLEDEFCLQFARCLQPGLQEALAGRHRINDERWERRCDDGRQYVLETEKTIKSGGSDWWVEHQLNKLQLIQQELAAWSDRGERTFQVFRQFEERGVDVVLSIRSGCLRTEQVMEKISGCWGEQSIRPSVSVTVLDTTSIELKPSVGDDYPAVLRQMKTNKSEVLFLEQYTGVGATREQFIKTFQSSNLTVIFKHQVEGLRQ